MKKLITVLCVSLMWVGNYYSKLYAYDMASKARVPAKDFTLTSENDSPFGIWSDGTIMWVLYHNAVNRKLYVYAYSMSTKARVSTKDLNNLIVTRNVFTFLGHLVRRYHHVGCRLFGMRRSTPSI